MDGTGASQLRLDISLHNKVLEGFNTTHEERRVGYKFDAGCLPFFSNSNFF